MFLNSFFLKTYCYCYSQKNSLQTPSLDDILLGNFTLSNWTILVEDLIRPKRGFGIYHYDTENENIAGK